MSSTLGCVLVGPGFCQRRSGLDPIAKRQIAGRPILEWVVNRLREAESLDGVTVVAAHDDATSEVADIVPRHTSVHVSTKADSLSRVLEAVEDKEVDSLVIVSADCPLVDPTLVDRLVGAVSDSTDYATYCSRSKGGLLNAKLGLLAEWVRIDSLHRADTLLTSPVQRDRFCQSVMAHPEEFTLKLVNVPVELDRNDVRFALETQEDWANAEEVVDALGYDLDWQGIAQLLERHPRLRQRMAVLNETRTTIK